jgi:hypothetical protein
VRDSAFVKERAEKIRGAGKRTAEGIVKIGQWLTEANTHLSHGQWLPWLKAEFGWSQQSANNFTRVYEKFKLLKFSNLRIDPSALYLLAARTTPELATKQVIERAEKGEPMTRAKVLEAPPAPRRRQRPSESYDWSLGSGCLPGGPSQWF